MKFHAALIVPFSLCAFLSLADPADNSGGLPELHLDSQNLRLSGIQTSKLAHVHQQSEFVAFGKAISLLPLIELQHRYLTTLTEQEQAMAKFSHSQKTSDRQLDLYNYGISSKQKLQFQQAQLQTDKATLDASRFKDQALVYEAKLKWGDTISQWLLSTNSTKLNPFLEGRQILVLVTLPANRPLPDNVKTIFIGASSNRAEAKPAELISSAPSTDESRQGYSYFFQTAQPTLKAGMNISAWIPETSENDGVLIPKSALLWVNDALYVYKKIDENSFQRILIKHFSLLDDGYFTGKPLKANDEIVTAGAQLLLSEELREQIPDEN